MPSPISPSYLDEVRLESEQRQMRVVLWILLVPLAVFGISDLLLSAHQPRTLLALAATRTSMLVIMLVIIEHLRRIRNRERFLRAMTITMTVDVVLILAVHLLRPRTLLTPFILEALLVIAIYGFLPNGRLRQFLAAGFLSAGSLFLLFFWHQNVQPVEFIAITTAFFVANALGITFTWHRHLREQREELMFAREQEARAALERTLAELRVLRGVLPICAHCRHIRADDGDWQQLEAYVREHSEADFSHGICPSCLEEHYAEDLEHSERRHPPTPAYAPSL